MKSIVTKVRDFIVNPFSAKMFFIVYLFLKDTLVGTMKYFGPVYKYGLAWAAVVLLYDFFTKRDLFKNRYSFFLVLLTISTAITVLLNYNVALKGNIIELITTIVYFFLIYQTSKQTRQDKEKAIKQLSIMNYTIILLSALGAVISIIMFLKQYTTWRAIDGIAYEYGISNKRLAGVYKNSNHPHHAIGIIAAFIQIQIIRKKMFKPFYIAIYVLLGLAMACNFVHMTLAQSRTTALGFMAATFIFVAFYTYAKLGKTKIKMVLRIGIGFILAICSVVVVFGAIKGTTSISKNVLSSYTTYQKEKQENNDPKKEKEKQEKEAKRKEKEKELINIARPDTSDSLGLLTGRQFIWEKAIESFKQKPIFGHGPRAFANDIYIKQLDAYFSNYHSLFFNTLAVSGIVGFTLLVLFLGFLIFHTTKFMFSKTENEYYGIIAVLFAFLAFMMILSLSEMTLLFNTTFIAVAFWGYSGYLVVLTDDKNPSKIDKPVYVADDFLKKIFYRRKTKNISNKEEV